MVVCSKRGEAAKTYIAACLGGPVVGDDRVGQYGIAARHV